LAQEAEGGCMTKRQKIPETPPRDGLLSVMINTSKRRLWPKGIPFSPKKLIDHLRLRRPIFRKLGNKWELWTTRYRFHLGAAWTPSTNYGPKRPDADYAVLI
jgi:hypothetical protein